MHSWIDTNTECILTFVSNEWIKNQEGDRKIKEKDEKMIVWEPHWQVLRGRMAWKEEMASGNVLLCLVKWWWSQNEKWFHHSIWNLGKPNSSSSDDDDDVERIFLPPLDLPVICTLLTYPFCLFILSFPASSGMKTTRLFKTFSLHQQLQQDNKRIVRDHWDDYTLWWLSFLLHISQLSNCCLSFFLSP